MIDDKSKKKKSSKLLNSIDHISNNIEKLLLSIGEDLSRESLINTPKRSAKAWQFLTQGYREDINKIINGALFETSNNEMVILKNVEFYSICEHHLLPFFGKCHIGYLPNNKLIGISKIGRIINHFSRRLQVQERLTKQIADCLIDVTKAKGVGVIIEAQHLCTMMRGIEKQNSIMTTSVMLGEFRENNNIKSEFLSYRHT